MENVSKLFKESISDGIFQQCSFSSPRLKTEGIKSINLKSINSQTELKIEIRHTKHNDIKTITVENFLNEVLPNTLQKFKQINLRTHNSDIQVLVNKKMVPKIISKRIQSQVINTSHNRKKNYLIPDGVPCDFLIRIGVMEKSGKVKSNYYKKFKQINRFLEMVDDLYKTNDKQQMHIVDFGCGKSYLTFALYYYFKTIKNNSPKITGIDLKQEVIDHCNEIANDLNYEGLSFKHGFIHDFKTDQAIDFVVTLHACDTATDDAILFSLNHNVEKMMFVPCCQHELNKQLQNEESSILISHGIFRDRLTALITDTMRSQLLEVCGYKVQNMEFIDMEHTAKNILLRCQKTSKTKEQKSKALTKYIAFKKQWNINPYLEKKLKEQDLLI